MSRAKSAPDDTLRHMRSVLLPALVLVVALSGCATTASTPTAAESPSVSVPTTTTPVETPTTPTEEPTSSPTPSPTPTAAPATLKSLIAAVKKAGYPCSPFDRTDDVKGSQASGFCAESEIGISLFADRTGVDAVLKLNEDSIEPGIFIAGPNFLISASEPATLKKIRTIVGGDLWPTD